MGKGNSSYQLPFKDGIYIYMLLPWVGYLFFFEMSFMDSYAEILFIHVFVGFILASLRLYCLPRNAERFMEIKVLLKGFVFLS